MTLVYVMRTALFWVTTQTVMVISDQHFRTTYQSHPKGSIITQLRSCSLSDFGSGRVISCSFLLVGSYELGLAQLDSNTTQSVSQIINFFYLD